MSSNTRFWFYNENTAKNAPYLEINGVTFFFSYSTLVGVRYISEGRQKTAVIKNYWGNTTGKHLNWIDNGNHGERLENTAFEEEAKKAMQAAGITELPTLSI